MTEQNNQKRRAVQAALEFLPEQGVIGLGTGSTAELFIEEVAQLIRQGRKYIGVPTSRRSRTYAERLNIPMLDDVGPWQIDMCVDGADEVSDKLDLIKGGGACHLREKVVNASSKLNIIVVDSSKISRQLGERWAVPVEVAPFGHLATKHHLSHYGSVTPRLAADPASNEGESAFLVTDSGNYIYDVKTGPIADPRELDIALQSIPGVLETGLFVGRATKVIVAGNDYIRIAARS